MDLKVKKMSLKKILLLINDIIIFILSILLLVFLLIISNKEQLYRNSRKLYLFQFILTIIIIIIDLFLNIKNIISNFKGHNKYGMLIRFFMFYLIIPCVILTYIKSNDLNHEDIKSASDIAFYIGFINDGFIISSMILSFIVIDKKQEEKILVNKNRVSINMNSVENMELLENSNISNTNQMIIELAKKEK